MARTDLLPTQGYRSVRVPLPSLKGCRQGCHRPAQRLRERRKASRLRSEPAHCVTSRRKAALPLPASAGCLPPCGHLGMAGEQTDAGWGAGWWREHVEGRACLQVRVKPPAGAWGRGQLEAGRCPGGASRFCTSSHVGHHQPLQGRTARTTGERASLPRSLPGSVERCSEEAIRTLELWALSF